jgi:hypothetical protein
MGRWSQAKCQRCGMTGHAARQCYARRSISTLEVEQGAEEEVDGVDQRSADYDPWLMGGLATQKSDQSIALLMTDEEVRLVEADDPRPYGIYGEDRPPWWMDDEEIEAVEVEMRRFDAEMVEWNRPHNRRRRVEEEVSQVLRDQRAHSDQAAGSAAHQR